MGPINNFSSLKVWSNGIVFRRTYGSRPTNWCTKSLVEFSSAFARRRTPMPKPAKSRSRKSPCTSATSAPFREREVWDQDLTHSRCLLSQPRWTCPNLEARNLQIHEIPSRFSSTSLYLLFLSDFVLVPKTEKYTTQTYNSNFWLKSLC